MEILVLLLIIFAVVNASKNKKQAQQQEQARKRQADVRSLESEQARAAERLRDYQAQRQRQGNPAAAPGAPMAPAVRTAGQGTSTQPGGAWRCTCGETNRAAARFCTACGKARYGGSMNYASTEGGGVSAEGAAAPGSLGGTKPLQARPHPVTASVTQHVVKPLTESTHRHVESSMTGIEECHEPAVPQPHERDAYARGAERAELPYGLVFNRDAVTQGVLYAEILGKPKALRKRGA